MIDVDAVLQLQLSWLKWLLPAGLFRRGFDQQRAQQEGSSVWAPLLPAQQQDELQDVWQEAVDKLQHNGGDVQVCMLATCGMLLAVVCKALSQACHNLACSIQHVQRCLGRVCGSR